MDEDLLGSTVQVQTPRCVVCGKKGEVGAILGQIMQWVKGVPVQNAFPDMEPGLREQLINGTHPACFDALFDEDDMDDPFVDEDEEVAAP